MPRVNQNCSERPLLLALAASLAGACTSSRAVTPWLRTYSHHPFEPLAEAGSAGRHGGRSWVERRVGDHWVTLDDGDVTGFGFAGGTRAVLGNTLLTQDGRSVPLACDTRGIGNGLRATPRGELLCVEVRGWLDRDVAVEERETVRVLRFDDEGAVRGARVVPVPVRRPPGAPVTSDVDTGFVGFLGDELVFSVLASGAGESWASDQWKVCRAFALTPAGTWRELGSMRFQVGDIWKIHAARQWRQALGLPVDPGGYPRAPDSRPDW